MSDLNEKLAALKGNYLERDDESDPNGRIYRDKVSGEIYHSVTRILGIQPRRNRRKPWSVGSKDPIHSRLVIWQQPGTAAHNSAEYA